MKPKPTWQWVILALIAGVLTAWLGCDEAVIPWVRWPLIAAGFASEAYFAHRAFEWARENDKV